ncbi:putative YigZ family protein [Desulfobaculum xiamenense]|uniref:Putative YigZ family protein n=1 Tax=Desulfobaculum xiamenense TaxID=995050 RepID=A0A846QMM5_9BACT|nr:YigZ family protein [Desulfobaculum xiamenense]NJB68437.1 putative YigZ family protein [Desulfobaculum xiamenense]
MGQEYLIPAVDRHCVEETIKRSRFITTIARADSIEAARAFIDTIRHEHPDATHYCWAFNAGPAGDTARIGCSDDGEPSGTAGRPMLNVLQHCDVGEIAVVVTRYFGGVKLGTGGLVRAYSGMVQLGLDSLPTRRTFEAARLRVGIDYRHITLLKRLLPEYEATIESEAFAQDATFTLMLPARNADALRERVTELTDATARIATLRDEA